MNHVGAASVLIEGVVVLFVAACTLLYTVDEFMEQMLIWQRKCIEADIRDFVPKPVLDRARRGA